MGDKRRATPRMIQVGLVEAKTHTLLRLGTNPPGIQPSNLPASPPRRTYTRPSDCAPTSGEPPPPHPQMAPACMCMHVLAGESTS